MAKNRDGRNLTTLPIFSKNAYEKWLVRVVYTFYKNIFYSSHNEVSLNSLDSLNSLYSSPVVKIVND